MAADLEEIILKSCDLPTIPSVAGKVVQLVSNQNTTAEHLNKAITVDQALTARVLKIANSSFYGCRSTINTISQAVVVIGFAMIRNIVMAASTKGVYKHFGLTEKMLHDHAVGTAMASYHVEKAIGLKKSEEAFLSGLLHDIGKVILNNTDPDRFKQAMQTVYNEGRDYVEVEQEVFGFTHSDVGSLVIKKWKFSEEMEQMIKYHHMPDQLDGSDPYVQRLSAIVQLADALCYKAGIGVREPQEIDLLQLPAVGILRLDPERMEKLQEDLQVSYEKERSNFE